ncbi:ferritin [Blattabacterium cuenoti]|uniref:ferritin n=1 Tax=Blattabacterium cuenoti TaxID=1653831 RepID=UPI00163C92F2|nr:ferritin [Blattabacterium cuenoti]
MFKLKEKIRIELIKQLNKELESSQLYLNMASWTEVNGFEGISCFLYDHSEEERKHMLKLMKYLNKRGCLVTINNIVINNNNNSNSLEEIFQEIFYHERIISKNINFLVELSLQEKDFFTYDFLQWYIKEQMEEEILIKSFLDKIKLIGDSKTGLYIFDQEVKSNFKK